MNSHDLTPQWRKSSRSNGAGACVEVASNIPSHNLIRDSKLGDGSPILSLTPSQFTSLMDAIKKGRLDR